MPSTHDHPTVAPRHRRRALSADDLAALDQLFDVEGPRRILRRDGLAVRTERTVWAARRA